MNTQKTKTELDPWIVSSTDGRGRDDGTWYIKTRLLGGWCHQGDLKRYSDGSKGFATKAEAQAEADQMNAR